MFARAHRLPIASLTLVLLAQPFILDTLLAQGCEPIRFTTPIDLGGGGQAYQGRHEWRLTLAYRRLHSTDWYVGTSQNPSLGPGGQAPVFNINTIVADVAYGVSDKFRMHLSVPYSSGSIDHIWADTKSHEQTATGLGDIGLMGELWLADPKLHENGNVSVGLGVKAPTGSHDKASLYYTAQSSVAFPADQTVQPGDGGWGINLQAQAFGRLAEGWTLYAFGSYLVSPKAESDVLFAPTSPVHWSVPDVYSARLGIAVVALPKLGLTTSLGLRTDGIPRRDLFGGGDSTTIKRTSNILYLDPAVSLTQGRTTLMVGVPIRLRVNRIKSVFEEHATGPISVNGGGFAKTLLFASYTYRL